jgi:hypothetical protein
MNSLRKTALVAGVFYLLTFVSIPTLALYGPVHDPNYIVGPGPDTPVLVGGVLEAVVALAAIGTAVVLYPVVKRHNEAVALGFVSARVLEAATIFVGVASLLVVVTLRQAGAGPDALVTDQALVALYDRMFLLGQSLIPVVNALLLYRSRLVPRVLPVVGFVGAALLLASAKCPVNGPLVARAGVSQGGRIGSVLLVDYAHSATGEGGNTTGKHLAASIDRLGAPRGEERLCPPT